MRGFAERLRSAFDGRGRGRGRDRPRDELPSITRGWSSGEWVSSEPRLPRERPRIITNIRADPASSVGDRRRPAALGTLLEGALAFALDDALEGRCEAIEIRLQSTGAAMVTHRGPGFSPARAAAGLQRWPWLRRSPEGEIILTQNLAAPVVTCALSHWCRFEVQLAEQTWRQAFYRGEAECGLRSERVRSATTHTRVHFRPDPLVFGDAHFDVDDLYMRALGLMTELSGVELRIVDERYAIEPLVFTGVGPG
ncbi:MAG: hypothetical protein R6X02_14610 [Enhygromyxa sp.]